jgi:hypothetical protein
MSVIDTVLCFEVNLLALWYWWQFLHSASLHSTQTNNAGSDFSSLSQDIHCVSARSIFCFSVNPITKEFNGSPFAQSSEEQLT